MVFACGLTTSEFAAVDNIGYHEYEVAAVDALSVEVLPAHTIVGVLINETASGAMLTDVAAVDVPQPFWPVTVYDCVADGVKAAPFTMPLVHVYVTAPVAVSVTVLPKQVVLVLLVIDKLGKPELTFTDITLEVVQFEGEVAVKV